MIDILTQIAQKHHVSIAQVMLAWLLDQDVTVLPKSKQHNHLIENRMAKHVKLDDHDRALIS